MNRLLTTLLIWLLMAALPLHAVAASVKLSCGPAQAQPEAAAAAAQVPEHASHGAGHPAAGDAHAHHGGHAAASESGAEDLSHSSCSACSVFCVGAVAPPSSSLSVPNFGGSEAVVIAPASLPAGVVPEGLQRPPRSSST